MDEGPGVNAEPQGKGVGGPGMHGVGERGNAAGEGGERGGEGQRIGEGHRGRGARTSAGTGNRFGGQSRH